MSKYTKYDAGTGEVILNFTTSGRDLELNRPFVEGWFSKDEYLIVNGEPERIEKEPIDQTEIYALSMLRFTRDGFLQKSDWTQVADAPVDKVAWATYRQQLRDLPENTIDPTSPTWPTPPN